MNISCTHFYKPGIVQDFKVTGRGHPWFVLLQTFSQEWWSFTSFCFVFFWFWSVTVLQSCVKFLLHNEVDQLYVYMCSLPLEPPSHLPPSHPSRPSQSTELSSLHYTAGFLYSTILHMAMYICQS